VVIDDLQYADAASVELLHALAGSTACAWIIAMRPDELGPAARAFVDAHAASTTTLTLPLQPLSAEAIAALLDSLEIEGIGGPAQTQVLRQRTGGELHRRPISDAHAVLLRSGEHGPCKHQARDDADENRRATRTAPHLPSGDVVSDPVIG
jgi:hypothetical protein